MQNKSKLNTILVVIIIILLAVGIWAILSQKKNSNVVNYDFPVVTNNDSKETGESSTPKPVVSNNSAEVRFSGKVEAFDTGCIVDAVCSITIGGRKVITTIGWTGGPVGRVKGVRGFDEITNKIGTTANVYATKDKNGEYTLYGNENYYIEIK
jgi:hypothetical protein